jgi:hypothetical protein
MSRKTPEGYVKDDIKKLMEAAFPHSWRFMPVQSGYGVGGVPDFIYCIYGLLIGIEAKAPGGDSTGLQLNTARFIRRAGGYVAVVDSEARCNQVIEEIRTILDTLDLI